MKHANDVDTKIGGLTFADYMKFLRQKQTERSCKQAKRKGILTVVVGFLDYFTRDKQDNKLRRSISTALNFSKEIGFWEDAGKCAVEYFSNRDYSCDKSS